MNAPWSKDRDRNTQRQFRKVTLERDGFTCRRCGHHDPSGASLQAHHVSPSAGQTLCRACHRVVDSHAR